MTQYIGHGRVEIVERIKEINDFNELKKIEIRRQLAHEIVSIADKILNEIVKLFPNVKVDVSTTNSIELLPKTFKNEILRIIIEERKEPKDALVEALELFKLMK